MVDLTLKNDFRYHQADICYGLIIPKVKRHTNAIF